MYSEECMDNADGNATRGEDTALKMRVRNSRIMRVGKRALLPKPSVGSVNKVM